MATISRYPFVSHLRSTTTMHIDHLAAGRTKHSATGAAFWFRPLSAAISEVPVDDREQPVLVAVRTSDLQLVTAPGTVTYRVTDPALAARRIDFSLDLSSGRWVQNPLETLGAMIHGATAAAVTSALAGLDLANTLATDAAELGTTVCRVLATDERLTSVGLEVVGVRFSLLRPEPEVERALQTPAREAIQQDADKATFERRALAVEREAAIGENELANEIELARRREQLIAQKGSNDRRAAQEAAAAEAIEVAAKAARTTELARAQAESETLIGAATAESERARLAANAEVSSSVLLALAAREAAANLPQVQQLVLTPDLLQGLMARLTAPESATVSTTASTAESTHGRA